MTKRKIAACLIVENQSFQEYMATDARKAARRAGREIEIFFAGGQAVVQIEQLFSLIRLPEDERPAGIIVEPIAGDGHARVAKAAARAGIGWIVINNKYDYISSLRAEHPELPIAAVSCSQVEIGKIQGQQFRALLPAGGEMLYLKGLSSSNPAQSRAKGMLDEIAGSGIHALELQGDWTEGSGEEALRRWLRLRGTTADLPKIIGCQNDSMAVGALRALQEALPKKNTVAITGCDGLQAEGRALVDSGKLAATVVTPSAAGPAVELLVKNLDYQASVPARVIPEPISYPPLADLSPLQ